MTNDEIQQIADRVIEALNGLAPVAAPVHWWTIVAALAPVFAGGAAIWAGIVAYRNLKTQQSALTAAQTNHAQVIGQQQAALSASQANHAASLTASQSNHEAVLAASQANHAAALAQKSDADARAEWWRRAQWALEAKSSANKELKENGLAMLDVLTDSDLAGEDERKFIRFVTEVPTISAETDNPAAGQPDWTETFLEALRLANPDVSDDDLRIAARFAADPDAVVDEPDEDGDNGDSEEDPK